MSRQDERGHGSLVVTVLVLGLIGQAATPAVARQESSRADRPIEIRLDAWRIHFEKGEQPRQAHVGEGDARKPTPLTFKDDGVNLPDIPLRDRMDPRFVEFVNDELGGLSCKLELSSGLYLTRKGSLRPGEVSADENRLSIRTTDSDPAGGIKVVVPEKITRKDFGALKLSIHRWSQLRARIGGAGVFSGELKLDLKNDGLHGGRPMRFILPLSIVIAGSRVIPKQLVIAGTRIVPDDLESPIGGALRAGVKPTARVVIDTVETAEKGRPSPTNDLDPGWSLKLETRGGGNDVPVVLIRLPLPIPVNEKEVEASAEAGKKEEPSSGGVKGDVARFHVPGIRDIRYWDPIEPPENSGYERAEEWKNELILQHLERRPVPLDEPDDVHVHRHTIYTDLPALYQPGPLHGTVSRDAGRQGEKREIESNVLSGYGVSTNMPVTGEDFEVWAVVAPDAASDQGLTLPKEGTNETFHAVLFKEEGPNENPVAVNRVRLERPKAEHVAGTPVRYSGHRFFKLEKAGLYRVKLYVGVEPPQGVPDDQTFTIPADWALAIKADEGKNGGKSVRALLEGESDDSRLVENPLRVFIDSTPLWWAWVDEPGYPKPYANNRPSNQDQHWVQSNQAMGLRLAQAPANESMRLRYQGIYRDRTEEPRPEQVDDQEPAKVPRRTIAGPRYDGQQPLLKLLDWVGESDKDVSFEDKGHRPETPKGKIIALKLDDQARKTFQFLDFQIDLTGDRSQQEQARKDGEQPMLARFVILGLDEEGQPTGRVYMRRFKVVAESWLDELSWEYLGLGGFFLAIVAFVVGRKLLKGRRPRRRPAVVTDDAPADRRAETDYFHGVGSTAANHDLDLDHVDRPEPPQPTRPPAAPAAPAQPSYLEGTKPESDAGAPSYLD